MNRTQPIRTPRRKRCRNPDCRDWFQPYISLQAWCSPSCGVVVARMAQRKQQRQRDRETKERLKTRRDYLKEAQQAFNAWVRERDHGQPCISCGRMPDDSELITGSYWHASHYRSVGACSSLRFDEDNVHAACSTCNSHKSGNILEYRIALVRKIGQARVDRLESAPKHCRWTKEQAIEIRDRYRREARRIKREREDRGVEA